VLCETPADRVPAHALIHDVTSARAAVASGYTLLKLKIGKLTPAELRRVETIAAAVPNAYLRLDVNGQWDPWNAHSCVRQLASPQIDWIEQPTAKPMDLQDLGVRIAWDESLRSEDWALALRLGSVAVIKPTWHGGPVTARVAAQAALSGGLHVCVTSVLGSAIDRWAAIHTALSLSGNVSVGLAGPKDPLAPEPVRGLITLPTTPGICP
jgi:L-alanine-DL-glutamate epimerase-like enolase superfamily enzyme